MPLLITDDPNAKGRDKSQPLDKLDQGPEQVSWETLLHNDGAALSSHSHRYAAVPFRLSSISPRHLVVSSAFQESCGLFRHPWGTSSWLVRSLDNGLTV